mgnify:CR=1 FL=1
MQRLTERIDNVPDGESGVWVKNHDYISAAIKLAEYEDLEEQGRLIKIPLEAYCIVDFKVRKGFVLEETYHMSRKPLLVVRYDDNSLKSHSGYLGISVFLTKPEAEAKLNELRF